MRTVHLASKKFVQAQISSLKSNNGKVIRRTSALKRKLDLIVSNQRHFLRARMPAFRKRELARADMVKQASEARKALLRLNSVIGTLRLAKAIAKPGEQGFVPVLSKKYIAALKTMLLENYYDQMSPVFLPEPEIEKLKVWLRTWKNPGN